MMLPAILKGKLAYSSIAYDNYDKVDRKSLKPEKNSVKVTETYNCNSYSDPRNLSEPVIQDQLTHVFVHGRTATRKRSFAAIWPRQKFNS